LAKEEVNLALYVYKSTNMLEDNKYMKKLRKDKFWIAFKSLKIIRHCLNLNVR
jgi:hypothetical protein